MLSVRHLRSWLILVLILVCQLSALAQSAPDVAAKNFFLAVAAKDYATSWGLLTRATQDWLVITVAKDAKIEDSKARELFVSNDESIQRGFWDQFRTSSTSEAVAKVATYTTASTDGEVAKVQMVINGKTLDLIMKNENGWKLGYQETFIPSGKLPQE